MRFAPEILFEDNHLLVVDKPAGMATMGSEGAAAHGPSLHAWGCEYVRRRYDKPGKVFLGIVHRLDAFTSGVVVLARTSKAASRLSEQFRRADGGPTKIYLAALEGHFPEESGELRDRLFKDDAAHRMRVSTTRGDEAVLRFRVLRRDAVVGRAGEYTLAVVRLITGRKHQIRVQFAARGFPVWADLKYGASRRAGGPLSSAGGLRGIALHAGSLTIEHPTRREPLTFQCRPPTAWGELRPHETQWRSAVTFR